MENKNTIPYPLIVNELSKITGVPSAVAETFIKEFFSQISELLSRSESVKIKNIGQFATVESNEEPIAFIPDKIISEALNEPFAFFEPVELNSEVVEDMLNEFNNGSDNDNIISTSKDTTSETEASTDKNEVAEDAQMTDGKEVEIDADDVKNPIEEDIDLIQEDDDLTQNDEIVSNNVDIDDEFEVKNTSRNLFSKIMFFIIGLFLGIIIGYLLHQSGYVTVFDERKEDQSVVASQQSDTMFNKEMTSEDTLESQREKIIPEIIYDTVTASNFLTSMSRKYYGEMNFWVYIYEENKDILDNPDKIKPGTKVVIPPAEKYGIDRYDSISVKNARLKAVKIYEPYRK